MLIQIDSREKARAIKKIIEEFKDNDVEYFVSKMYVGDYCRHDNPKLIIDRKQNIAEIAQNATSGHDRFKRELERLKSIDAKMIVLIEQNTIDKTEIKDLSDLILWKPKFGEIIGERVYRILKSWGNKYPVTFEFCSKKDTGKRIIEILSSDNV